ncbi:hypothetical protein JW752_05490 [Candidatus Peregrinibacteria bacterium]|nr:hypothetical protein [Candidatus Peregrinibacteria bacterium]
MNSESGSEKGAGVLSLPDTPFFRQIREQQQGHFEPLPSTEEEIREWRKEWERVWGPEEFWSF